MNFIPLYLLLRSVADYEQLLLGCHFLKVLCENWARNSTSRQKHQTSSPACSERLNDLATWDSNFSWKDTCCGLKKKKKKGGCGGGLVCLGSWWSALLGACACIRERSCPEVPRAVTKEVSGCPGKQNTQKGICRIAALAARMTGIVTLG